MTIAEPTTAASRHMFPKLIGNPATGAEDMPSASVTMVHAALVQRLGDRLADRRDTLKLLSPLSVKDMADDCAIERHIHLAAGDPAAPALLVSVDASLAALIVQYSYGGAALNVAAAAAPRPRPGRAEVYQAARLADQLLAVLDTAAAAIGGVQRRPMSFDQLSAARRAIDPAQTLAFAIGIGDIIIDAALLLHMPSTGRDATGGAATATDSASAAWQSQLSHRMLDIRLPVRSVVARPTLSVAQMMALQVGDVIPIACPRSLPLLVADQPMADGVIGEQDGRAAFMIDVMTQEARA